MINADRLRRIMGLAVPIIGGMVSQNILNLVDVKMVGSYGPAALGAVGLGGFATFTSQALILGISTGVQATASRRLGEGKHERTAVSLNAGLFLVLLIAPLFSFLLYHAAPAIYPILNDDPEVIIHGVPYWRARLLGITFIGMNFAFRGYWNGVNRAWFYMGTLILMHSTNIFLNWVFIYGNLGAPEMGAIGAGIATTCATGIGCAIYFILGFTQARKAGFMCIRPTWDEMWKLVKLSLPNSFQQLFFAAGFTATFTIIGMISAEALGAATVLINVTLVAILPGMALGLAAASLVGQALGRKEPDDASAWAFDVLKVGIVILGLLGAPMWITPDLILEFFIPDDPQTVAIALWPMRLVGITMVGEAFGLILMHALLGAGATMTVMKISIGLQWLMFLPLAYLVGPVLGYGLVGVYLIQGVYRLIQSLVFLTFWKRGAWREIEV